jgi:hypothetical protein
LEAQARVHFQACILTTCRKRPAWHMPKVGIIPQETQRLGGHSLDWLVETLPSHEPCIRRCSVYLAELADAHACAERDASQDSSRVGPIPDTRALLRLLNLVDISLDLTVDPVIPAWVLYFQRQHQFSKRDRPLGPGLSSMMLGILSSYGVLYWQTVPPPAPALCEPAVGASISEDVL